MSPPIPAPSDPRRHPRIPLVLHAVRGGLHMLTEDLSEGGIFLRTNESIPVGEQIDVTLSFPGLMEPLDVQGTVAWNRKPAPGAPAGVGVIFSADTLARAPVLARLLARSYAAPASQPSLAPARSLRVLVVEDSSDMALMYRHALRRVDPATEVGRPPLTVDFAQDGWEALKLLREQPHDLVLLDLGMPVMGGCELLKRIRADPAIASVRTMVISGAGPAQLEEATAAGADAVLPKPVALGQIVETARMLLEVQVK